MTLPANRSPEAGLAGVIERGRGHMRGGVTERGGLTERGRGVRPLSSPASGVSQRLVGSDDVTKRRCGRFPAPP